MLAGMRDMSVTEQRYQAVLDVIGQGRAVMEVASQWGVSGRTVERWLARYEAQGLEGLPTVRIGRSGVRTRCPPKWKSWCSNYAGRIATGALGAWSWSWFAKGSCRHLRNRQCTGAWCAPASSTR